MTQFDKKINLFKSLRESFVPAFKFYFRSVSTSMMLPKISRFINKRLYNLGIGSALNRYDNSFTLYSAKADAKLYRKFHADDIFCNFGSGAYFHNRWRNYDFPGQSAYYKSIQGVANTDFYPIDLCVDNLRLPLEDASVSLIYCSHTLEHLESNSAIEFLRECYRILKPGGVIRLAIPSTDNDHKILSVIVSQNNIALNTKRNLAAQASQHLLTDSNKLEEQKVYDHICNVGFDAQKYSDWATSFGVSSQFLASDPSRHISFWDYSKVKQAAEELLFSACIPFYRGASLEEPFLNLNVFDTTEPHISLYLELAK